MSTETETIEDEIHALVQVSRDVAAPSEDEGLPAVLEAEYRPEHSILQVPDERTYLQRTQADHLEWQTHNFGPPKSHEQFMGMTEELGELAHALLKRSQGIRGTKEEHDAAAKDAIGDLLIFTLALCNAEGWDLQSILEETWGAVRQRDWVRFPGDGRTA